MGRLSLVVVLLLSAVGCSGSDKNSSSPATGGSAAAGSAGKTSSGGSAIGTAGDTSDAGGEGPSGGRNSNGGSSSSAGTAGGDNKGSGGDNKGSGGDNKGSGGDNKGSGGDDNTTWVTTLVDFPEAPRGDLNISQTTQDKVNFTYSAYAKFASMREQWDGCTKHQLGDCWYYECPTGSYPVGSADNKPQTAGGYVTVENGSVIQTLALAADYYSGQGTDAFWPLSGGSIWFENHDSKPLFRLEAQSPPTVWLKTLNGQALPLTTLDRSQGAKVTWEAQGEGTAFFSIYSYSGVNVAAVCTFDAAAGVGTLPATVLEHLDPGDEYYVLLRGDRRAKLTADGFVIEATLYGYGEATASKTAFKLE